ncbi:RNase adapter RapZ [Ruania halotolerans]|uniref:RNase adapter RapZ n=1 Tax=Ruania halotolerans TaxID=2897773 RepID=UPI001E448BEB|nr:RNase adapter RapZ [Ruania halotolerans]UFU08131.1 RNase adapter RapZ [Ruania halotolerans]
MNESSPTQRSQAHPGQPTTVPYGIPLLDESTGPSADDRPEIMIITGMSGAGRSHAASVLEDLDWYVVDNLPPKMLMALAGMMTQADGGVRRLAAVVDVRSREFFSDLVQVLDDLRGARIDYRIVFLDASDEALVRRFEKVRRPHPLQGDGRMLDGISEERRLLAHLRSRADVTLDTSDLSVHDLARAVRDLVANETETTLRLTTVSFGFKYGLPLDADHVVDVRFLKNPYWVSELRNLTGKDEPVRDYVLGLPGAEEFVQRWVAAIEPVLDGYTQEQKPYVTIAVGCTGGKHRSVAISEAIATTLRGQGRTVRTVHRDLGRE